MAGDEIDEGFPRQGVDLSVALAVRPTARGTGEGLSKPRLLDLAVA